MRSADGTTQQTPAGPADQQPQERPHDPDGGEPAEGEGPARIGFIGKTLGRFHIKAELGRGGMATVYRAHDPQLGRDVAVKVMHGFFAGRAEVEARFRREATAVAAIRHPSILALFDFAPPVGEEPGYIVSELIEGPGLRRLVEDRGGRLLPEVSALIAIRVAEALGAAHAAGIVHRDVKPDNVLIDRAGGGARVVLTDFGVAHVAGMDTMTATGAVLGSPAYMSPEQARGADVGPPSDVFSLGVMLYQLSTGHLPFTGKDPLLVIAALLRGEYLRPGKIEARVGPDLEQVITRCLQRDPGARFPDGNAVATALRDNLAAAEIADEELALRRYLADPDAYEREVSPRISAAARGAAERARRRGQQPRALAEIGRALAYAPGDADARALLARIGTRARTRWVGAGITAAAIAAVVVGAALVAIPRFRTQAHPETASSATVNAAKPAPAAAPLAREPEAIAPPPGVPSNPDPAPAAAAAAPGTVAPGTTAQSSAVTLRQRRGNRGVVIKGVTAAAVSPPAPPASEPEIVAPAPVEAAPDNPRPPGSPGAAAEKPTADQPAMGRIVLRATQGFCEPSLDGHPPSLRTSTYDNLAAGPHEIFCTLPGGGGKIHVATYDLRPGARPSLLIIRGPQDRPILRRQE